MRAAEGAACVPEELTLEKIGGDRGAVERDEQLLLPGRELVDRAGDELLSGARLPRHEDGASGRRHLPHELEDGNDRRRAPHELAERAATLSLLAQKAILEPEARKVERATDHHL